jgi:opacity protein-like surface antigen
MTVRSMFAISLFALAAGATDVSAQARSTTAGFHLGAALNGSSIKFDLEDEETGLEAERESGAGITLTAGYNFTPQFGLLINLTGANLEVEGGSLGLGHADLAGRFSLANPATALVPYLELGVTSIALVEDEESDEDVTISGTGFTGAAGLNYFFSPKLALDANLRFTMGELDTFKVGGNSLTADEGVDADHAPASKSACPGSRAAVDPGLRATLPNEARLAHDLGRSSGFPASTRSHVPDSRGVGAAARTRCSGFCGAVHASHVDRYAHAPEHWMDHVAREEPPFLHCAPEIGVRQGT